jgi:hypothetical protein
MPSTGPDPDLYIWIQDAVREYHRSRPWLQSQVEKGKIGYVKYLGNPRIYLLKSDLIELLSRPEVEVERKSHEDAD